MVRMSGSVRGAMEQSIVPTRHEPDIASGSAIANVARLQQHNILACFCCVQSRRTTGETAANNDQLCLKVTIERK